jgi:hypothetical protein
MYVKIHIYTKGREYDTSVANVISRRTQLHGVIGVSFDQRSTLTKTVPHLYTMILLTADPGNRAVKDVFLRQLTWWDCGFESR